MTLDSSSNPVANSDYTVILTTMLNKTIIIERIVKSGLINSIVPTKNFVFCYNPLFVGTGS